MSVQLYCIIDYRSTCIIFGLSNPRIVVDKETHDVCWFWKVHVGLTHGVTDLKILKSMGPESAHKTGSLYLIIIYSIFNLLFSWKGFKATNSQLIVLLIVGFHGSEGYS